MSEIPTETDDNERLIGPVEIQVEAIEELVSNGPLSYEEWKDRLGYEDSTMQKIIRHTVHYNGVVAKETTEVGGYRYTANITERVEPHISECDQQMNDTEQSGIILYTADGDPVKVTLMDEDDEYLRLVEKLQEGVYAYENKGVSLTMFLKEPKVECVYCERPVGYGKIADHHMRVHPNERWNPSYYPEVYERPNFVESPDGEDAVND